jgi:hypothetical protein
MGLDMRAAKAWRAWLGAGALAAGAALAGAGELAPSAGALGAPLSPPAGDPLCTSTYAPADSGTRIMRFGIDPEPAGSAGVSQTSAKPEDPNRTAAALAALRPAGRELVLRVNRLFWSDGEGGIQRFQAIVAGHDAAGFDSELQVRYHPSPQQQGDIAAWTAYVRHVVDVFAPDRHVVAMTITNEVNLSGSPNTSDGSYPGAESALVQGIEAARSEADAHGRPDLAFGFTYAYRGSPAGDASFWSDLASTTGGASLARALGFVGVDLYPGSFYPPTITPPDTPGREAVLALGTVRQCYMAQAGIPATVPLWVTENGYPTTPGSHTEAQQAAALTDMVQSIDRVSASAGVTDYRWFNLRDNDSSSAGLFDTDGLLRDDYSPKPSFADYRALVAALGTVAPASSAAPGARRGACPAASRSPTPSG